jgi:hypothetical protein
MIYLFKKDIQGRIVLVLFLLGAALSGLAQSVNTVSIDSVLIVKNFPLLSRLDRNKETALMLKKNKTFKLIRQNQDKRAEQALQHCTSVSCYGDSLKLTQNEVNCLGDELITLYKHKKAFRKIIIRLRSSGSYALYEAAADTGYLRNAWNNDAKGINRIIEVYIQGKPPRYARIDSISFAAGDESFKAQLSVAIRDVQTKPDGYPAYLLPLNMAVRALKINARDEAARYEPLTKGLNELPVAAIAKTNWSSYPYSVILVPGLGPETAGIVLDPQGMKRCEGAVLQFRKGLAPFIVVSGGNVHPFQTRYNEAVEMKRYLVEELHVPTAAVFIEPHARHTTTNLRNTCRIIYRFGLPADKPVLIVTDKSQSSYIVNQMAKVAMRDLGYLPYKNLKKITEYDTEFYPIWNSVQADPLDPLDP